LLPDSTTTGHLFYDNTTSQATGGNFVMSCYAKAAGLTKFGLRESQSVGYYATFNLSNGTIVEAGSSVTASIQNMGNGWYRCVAVVVGNVNACIGLVPLPAAYTTGNPLGYSYAGNGTDGVLVYQPQLEVSATYATSPISTAGVASATRLVDAAFKTGISSLIGQTAGTIFLEVERFGELGFENLIFLGDGTLNTFVNIVYDNGVNRYKAQVRNGGVTSGVVTAGAAYTGKIKIAIAYAADDLVMYINGVLQATDTSVTIPSTGLGILGLGSFYDTAYGSDIFRGAYSQALLFKTRLTNAQLAELTTL
jgi:hypothetical protein